MSGSGVSVERLMRELGSDISNERRARIIARGGAAEYRDPELYARVEEVFRRVLDARDQDALLLPHLLDDEEAYTLQLRLRYASHRKGLGPLLIFIKRAILLPLNRWLYEYSLENFRRQQRVNRLLFACIEELAIENATLRREIAREAPDRGASPRA
jgi:hypothetical protein